jgi:hypothetical protein
LRFEASFRIANQHRSTGHHAFSQVISDNRTEMTCKRRSLSPYQFATVIVVQCVVESVKTFSRVGSRFPFLRGRPPCLGVRGGVGA